MSSRREILCDVFRDTQAFYSEEPALIDAVNYGRENTKFYDVNDYPELPILGSLERFIQLADDPDASISAQVAAMNCIQAITDGKSYDPVIRSGEVRITKSKTFESSMNLHKEFPDKKIAVLNFASATRPGGGVKTGSSAQEESLCRCSTLFPTLDRRWLWQKYYDYNRNAKDVRHTDACIYSPGVIICKTDEDIPERMDKEDFVTVDVISCAAPNLRDEPANFQNPETGAPVNMDPMELFGLHLNRARHIFHIAACNKVDILVLGAFGCGAFQNDPYYVAKAYAAAMIEYLPRFDVIEYAIYCRDYETENYEAFKKELGRYERQ